METVDEGALEPATRKRKLSPHAQALIKTIGVATVVLYALGWAVLFARQDGWDASVRATYGYQIGWVACLASCAVALVLRRGHEPVVAPLQVPQLEMTRVCERPRATRRRFVTGDKSK